MAVKLISRYLGKTTDLTYTSAFLGRLLVLYLFFRGVNWAVVGLVSPEGRYSPFVDRYLDYVTPLKLGVLSLGSALAALFGVPSRLLGGAVLEVENGGQLRMAWACCGLEIMSFWAAFALADTTPWRKKIVWCLGGVLAIALINSVRVALLVAAKQHRWEDLLQMDQHELFNYAGYIMVLLLMFVYYRKNVSQVETPA